MYTDPSERSALSQIIDRDGQVLNYECLLCHRDGSRFWASENIYAVLDKEGNVCHYQGFIANINERRKAVDDLWENNLFNAG